MTNCKICGSTNVKSFGKPKFNESFPRIKENNYEIFQCKKCTYYYIFPEIDLNQEEWSALYENNYFVDRNATKWQEKLHNNERKGRLKLIVENLEIEKGKFLDIGCGEGYVLKESHKNGFEPYGVDIAYNLVDEMKSYNFFKGNIFEAKFPDNHFSVIYMDSVLEHVINPLETIIELKRVLKPGGVLLIIVPNEDSLFNSFTEWFYKITLNSKNYGKIKPFIHPFHIQGFNKRSLRSLINRVHLKSITIKSFGGDYMFWKSHKFGSKSYIRSLITFPIGLLSILFKNQIQLLSLSKKENE